MKDIKSHYLTWKTAVDHLVSQGVKYIGWANSGVPYPKGEPIRVNQGNFCSNTTVNYYPNTNEVICTDMS